MDLVSEFSVESRETVLQASDNILDIRFSTADFDNVNLAQVIGAGRQLDHEKVRTFLTVDFFNHDSQQSDTFTGYKPIINTVFSFQNQVDDFYIKYLDSETLQVDIWAIRPGTRDQYIRLGTSEIIL